MNNNFIKYIDFKSINLELEKTGYVHIKDFFQVKFISKEYDKRYIITKTHNFDLVSNNKTVYVQGILDFFIYSYFNSSYFYNLLYSIFNKSLITDKIVNIASVENHLGLNVTGKGIIADLYENGDFYNFILNKNIDNYGFYIYILDGNNYLNLSIDGELLKINKNDLVLISKDNSKIQIKNNNNSNSYIVTGNLLNSEYRSTEIINKCNLS